MNTEERALPRVGIIVGSTRPGRRGPTVAAWVQQAAARLPEAEFTVIDVADQNLPLLDEPVPAVAGDYRNPHTREWAALVAGFDAFVVVSAVHNNSFPAALKNAIDYLYAEWNGKVVGLVGYGAHGGTRAIDHLRSVFAEVKAAVVPTEVSLEVLADFDFSGFDPTDRTATGVCAPRPAQEGALARLLDDVVAWAGVLARHRVAA